MTWARPSAAASPSVVSTTVTENPVPNRLASCAPTARPPASAGMTVRLTLGLGNQTQWQRALHVTTGRGL